MRFIKNKTIKKLLVELLELTIDLANSAAQTASPLIRPGRYLINPFYDEMCAERERMHLDYLARRKLLKRQSGPSSEKVIYHMTEDAVCIAALEKVRRIINESPKWDGKLRAITFDIPESRKAVRLFLRRFLKELDCYCFQKSVWITSHDISKYFKIFIIAAKLDRWVNILEVNSIAPMPKALLKKFNLREKS